MTHSQRIDNKGRRRARWLSVYNKQTGTHSRTCTREQETKKKVGREVDGLPPFFFLLLFHGSGRVATQENGTERRGSTIAMSLFWWGENRAGLINVRIFRPNGPRVSLRLLCAKAQQGHTHVTSLLYRRRRTKMLYRLCVDERLNLSLSLLHGRRERALPPPNEMPLCVCVCGLNR